MNFGNEIARDCCPQKYYEKKSVIKESLPAVVVSILIALYSGALLNSGGVGFIVTLIIEVAVILFLNGMIMLMLNGTKKYLAQTYIIICENGIHGVCPYNGFKNRDFAISYGEIKKIKVSRDQLFIYPRNGRTAVFTLHNAQAAASLIQSRIG